MFRWQKMQHFFSLGILLYRQSKRWRCLAQEEADVGKLCARRNMGVWQWGASTRWQQAMDQDVSWVEPSQANKGIKALPVCFERSFSIFFDIKHLMMERWGGVVYMGGFQQPCFSVACLMCTWRNSFTPVLIQMSTQAMSCGERDPKRV